MEIVLTPEAEKIVADKVGSGRYHSPSEVVSQALRVLDLHDSWQATKLERLKADIKIGLDQINSGDVVTLDVDAIKAKGRQLIAEASRK